MKISIKNITKKFGEVTAVDALNVEIADGEFFFFLGPSGCGKTTMLRMIAGFDRPTDGVICFDDQDITYLPPNKRNVGMVFQNYALWPHMSVFENVAYGLKIRKLPKDIIEERVQEVLCTVKMEKYNERSPNQLSGGQQQRIALARALVIRPSVLLLDEPLSNLDAKLRLEMRDEIRRIQNETQITTIYVTHDQKEALSMGDSIALMKDGKIVQRGSPRNLHREPLNSFVAGFIGETNFLSGQVIKKEEKKVTLKVNEFNEYEIVSSLSSDQINIGDTLKISIRPEAICFAENLSPDVFYNELNSKIEMNTYLGEAEQYILKVNSSNTELKAIQLNPFMKRNVGLEEKIYVHPKDVVLLRD